MYMPVYKVYVVSCLTTTEERVAKMYKVCRSEEFKECNEIQRKKEPDLRESQGVRVL